MRGLDVERIGCKTMEPLFPRLHVKDTEKGGPKPPPRNKMAIYEEHATPSRRLALGLTTMTSLKSNNNDRMDLVGSSGHGGSSEKRTVSPFYSPRTTHITPTLRSACPSDGIFSKALTNSAPSVSKNSSVSGGCNSFQPRNYARPERRSTNEDDLDRAVPFCTTEGAQLKFGLNRLKRASVFDLDPDNHSNTPHANGQSSSRECEGPSKRLASVSAVRPNSIHLLHESSNSLSSNAVSESSKKANEDFRRINMSVEENNDTLNDAANELPKVLGNIAASELRTKQCVVPSLVDNSVCPGNASQCDEETQNKPLRARELDCKTSVGVSLDAIVLKIGQENFWKTRRILINQQRVFAFQIFELHRLVKVQRCLATSPHSFVEDVNKGVHEVPNIEEVPPAPPPSSVSLPPRPLQLKNKNPSTMKMPFPSFHYDSERFNNPSNRFNTTTSPPPQSTDLCLSTAMAPTRDNTLKPIQTPAATAIQPQTGNPTNSHDKMLPHCLYPQLENQLLVPVMSSEGLVYKPYTGACPPNSHLYGTPAGSYFLNAAYGIPASQQEMVHGFPITVSYLDPRDLSTTKSSSHDDVSSRLPCILTHQKSSGTSDHDLQGSTESSSVEWASQDALPLFPMEPTTTTTTNQRLEFMVPTFEKAGYEKETRAIKPVPLDGRRINESAMRIFRSIQEERRRTKFDE